MYSLEDIFNLFEFDYTKPITEHQMKKAKHRVLMTHPDKSKLPPEYFIFYKKAYESIAKYYIQQERQNQRVPTEAIPYCPIQNHDKRTTHHIKEEASKKEFQKKFNQIFEENMAQKVDSTRNAWFSSETPIMELPKEKVSVSNMNSTFDRIKEKQASMVLYRGVEEMVSGGGGCVDLYDTVEEGGDDGGVGRYVSCDPFSKLKYDDLRKVHKDQTVFAVSERDFQKVPQYSSVDHFMRERGAQVLDPMEKTAAENLLLEKEKEKREWAMRQQHAANLKTAKYEEQNKKIISNFLYLM
jgi:hypothetical protein